MRIYNTSAAVVGLAALLGTTAILQLNVDADSGPAWKSASHALYVRDEGHLHLNGSESSGQLLVEEGKLTGQLPCNARVTIYVASTVDAHITVYLQGGAITASGKEVVHYSNAYASFGGSVTVNRSSGRYAHARGTGGFYGVVNRRTDSLVLQTTGKLYY